MTQEEKKQIATIIRRETACGLMDASIAIEELVKALKRQPRQHVMDAPEKLVVKIYWESKEKQSDKELLLKDLCARLPYKVKVHFEYKGNEYTGVLDAIYPNDGCVIVEELKPRIQFIEGMGTVDYGRFEIEEVNFKPYLRSMSSMTEEEKFDYFANIKEESCIPELPIQPRILSVDWLNAHHFDYMGLIEKGLAIEAPEGMYEIS